MTPTRVAHRVIVHKLGTLVGKTLYPPGGSKTDKYSIIRSFDLSCIRTHVTGRSAGAKY